MDKIQDTNYMQWPKDKHDDEEEDAFFESLN